MDTFPSSHSPADVPAGPGRAGRDGPGRGCAVGASEGGKGRLQDQPVQPGRLRHGLSEPLSQGRQDGLVRVTVCINNNKRTIIFSLYIQVY